MSGRISARVAVALALVVRISFAEPVNEPIKQARQRFDEGVEAVEAGDYERARVSFEQAYVLKPAPEVLKNLGLAEVDSGHVVVGARHLTEWLRRFGEKAAEAERSSVERVLERLDGELGRLKFSVDAEGATLFVDREVVDHDAAQGVWYVSPGDHEVVARSGSDSQAKTVSVAPGQLVIAVFELDSPEGSAIPSESEEPAQAADVQSNSGRTTSLLVGAGLTAAAIGVATGFTLGAWSADNDVERLQRSIGGTDSECSSSGANTCAQLEQALEDRDRASTVAISAWVAAGVFGGATLAAWFLWPDARQADTARLTPAVGRGYAGAFVRGSF